jgi:hypothetical protein
LAGGVHASYDGKHQEEELSGSDDGHFVSIIQRSGIYTGIDKIDWGMIFFFVGSLM